VAPDPPAAGALIGRYESHLAAKFFSLPVSLPAVSEVLTLRGGFERFVSLFGIPPQIY